MRAAPGSQWRSMCSGVTFYLIVFTIQRLMEDRSSLGSTDLEVSVQLHVLSSISTQTDGLWVVDGLLGLSETPQPMSLLLRTKEKRLNWTSS